MAAGGPAQAGRPLRGDEPPAPVTAYGRSKLAGEEAVRSSSLPWSILRPPMVYGPRDAEVLKVFRLARFGIVPVFGDGTQELSAVYAPDLAEALVAAATSPRTVGRTYSVCHPEIFTSRAFVQAVGRAVNPGRQEPVRVVPLPRWLAVGALTLTGTVARLARQATILTTDKANEFFQPAWTGDPERAYRRIPIGGPRTRSPPDSSSPPLGTGSRDGSEARRAPAARLRRVHHRHRAHPPLAAARDHLGARRERPGGGPGVPRDPARPGASSARP